MIKEIDIMVIGSTLYFLSVFGVILLMSLLSFLRGTMEAMMFLAITVAIAAIIIWITLWGHRIYRGLANWS